MHYKLFMLQCFDCMETTLNINIKSIFNYINHQYEEKDLITMMYAVVIILLIYLNYLFDALHKNGVRHHD